eukprot:5504966-Amphidinium_carterae.1
MGLEYGRHQGGPVVSILLQCWRHLLCHHVALPSNFALIHGLLYCTTNSKEKPTTLAQSLNRDSLEFNIVVDVLEWPQTWEQCFALLCARSHYDSHFDIVCLSNSASASFCQGFFVKRQSGLHVSERGFTERMPGSQTMQLQSF